MSGDLATVSRSRDQWWEVAGLLGWKAGQLAVGWYGGYDSMMRNFIKMHKSKADLLLLGSDVAALTFLSHVPYHYFLVTFYLIRPTTSVACIVIDTLAAFLPFYYLKVSSSIHSIKTPKGVAANRSVINDYQVQVFTSLLAAGIYAVVVFGSYASWLPVYLVTHFDGIRDISTLHNGNFPYLIASYLPIGFAAKIFLFTPSEAAKPDRYDKEIEKFNPETATLSETIMFNLWGYSKRTRILMKRTATLAAVSGLHTYLQTYISLEGTEALGAAGWSSVWALAGTVTGAVYCWVESV